MDKISILCFLTLIRFLSVLYISSVLYFVEFNVCFHITNPLQVLEAKGSLRGVIWKYKGFHSAL